MISNDQVRRWNMQKGTVNLTLDGNLNSASNLKIVAELLSTLNMRVRTLRKGKSLRIVIAEE